MLGIKPIGAQPLGKLTNVMLIVANKVVNGFYKPGGLLVTWLKMKNSVESDILCHNIEYH